MKEEPKNYCCECACRIVVANTGAKRQLPGSTTIYWLCVECLVKQPERPKWSKTLIGLAALPEVL